MQTTASTDCSIDANEANFHAEVLDESQRRPVVVDFWAPWCGPCRTLGPLLERLAAEGEGSWRLAKVNVDENQRLATLFSVQSIPSVKAFHKGQLVEQFVGVLPEPQLRSWLEGFVPGPAEEAVEEARSLEAAGKLPEARAAYERALSIKQRHGEALLGLARLEATAGERENAERHLDQILPPESERLAAAIAQLRLELQAGAVGSLEELRLLATKRPDDLEAQVAYGRGLAAAGQHEQALQLFLEVVKKSPKAGAGEEARKAMLEVFGVIGARSELADEYRSLLAAELYK
ncbi:thioredoxin [Vulgatibacter sp.]|uniref:thioredoxin n=1 Tax=Vulgatibacter sp. TaxID=1971226 RepID=UPI0035626BA6